MKLMRGAAFFVLLIFAPCLLAQSTDQKFAPNWKSLDQRPIPSWFGDSKFGIFIHWGVYSVPAWSPAGTYSEWYWNHLMKGKSGSKDKEAAVWEFHVKNYGADFDYQDFAPQFKAELFDPTHWADLFARSGAKYIVLTSKHHEGFCLWKNEQANQHWGRPWNSVDVGPKRDLLGDLTGAVRKSGLKMGIYYSLYEWYNPLWLSDKKKFIEEHMIPQFKEVVTRYQPSLIFSDGEWDLSSSEWKSEELLAWLFNDSPVRKEVVVNDRWGKECRHKHGDYYTTEYGAGLKDASHPWEESRGMGFSYGYNRDETLQHYRTKEEMIWTLIDLVSKGGNFLLDIGPSADGRIPVIMEERLTQIGDWLKINGEAIYSTHPWRKSLQWSEGKVVEEKFGETMTGFDINQKVYPQGPAQAHVQAFFTEKGNSLYAIAPRWPGRTLRLKGVSAAPGSSVMLLGYSKTLPWKPENGDLVISCPDLAETGLAGQAAYTIKISQAR
jgi:alpha-L-fucosidase